MTIPDAPRPAPVQTPQARHFRAWLRDSLKALDISPTEASRLTGASPNLAGSFLRDPGRDITLTRAAALETLLRDQAAARSVDLPPVGMPPRAAGGSSYD